MYGFVIGIIIVLCVLLVLVILAQNSKGGGLTSQFGGSSASNIIGVKKTGDLLEKLTWGFIIGIIVLTLSSTALRKGDQQSTDDILNNAADQVPAAPAPGSTTIPGAIPDTGSDSTAQ